MILTHLCYNLSKETHYESNRFNTHNQRKHACLPRHRYTQTNASKYLRKRWLQGIPYANVHAYRNPHGSTSSHLRRKNNAGSVPAKSFHRKGTSHRLQIPKRRRGNNHGPHPHSLIKDRRSRLSAFQSGWDKRWGKDTYFGDYACIDDEVFDYIIAGNYKGIGFDVIGLDPIADEDLTRHKKLFNETEIVNIENLKNLDRCGSAFFWFSCFPLKLENFSHSPIRAIAWFE